MKKQIENSLMEILKDLLGIDISALPDEAKKYPLLSAKFGIEPYQMIKFMEAVEKKFEFKVSQEDIVDRKFNTFLDIVEIIMKSKIEKG
ncbi:peptide maturation system acyl carrier-related protein [Anaerobacterium chartisolvens]|uniref:Peptide maturation system acyl carrier-related protein n=1 Tax=Anaerobacterium chartisolvens TaxID=1297424 RepID=A0A369AT04_9FIRM|nr:hypothetical protein [Anaerobacterium chartisolvens]RCX12215.1 peptide maturation system acyl carrier-related protein [Anaerobacterium chartisolvens]